jgi:hypothetical protein
MVEAIYRSAVFALALILGLDSISTDLSFALMPTQLGLMPTLIIYIIKLKSLAFISN